MKRKIEEERGIRTNNILSASWEISLSTIFSFFLYPRSLSSLSSLFLLSFFSFFSSGTCSDFAKEMVSCEQQNFPYPLSAMIAHTVPLLFSI
jgi:hypothetical protein